MAPDKLLEEIGLALQGDEHAVENFMAPLRETIATFQYLRSDAVVDRIDAIASGVYQDLQLIERHTNGSDGLAGHWNQFYPFYMTEVSSHTREYLWSSIRQIQGQFESSDSPFRERVHRELEDIDNQVHICRYTFEDLNLDSDW